MGIGVNPFTVPVPLMAVPMIVGAGDYVEVGMIVGVAVAVGMAEAIASLPADRRRVLVMRDVQGLSGRTVAEALGLSTAAMKSRLHRARAEVRQTLRSRPGWVPAGAGWAER